MAKHDRDVVEDFLYIMLHTNYDHVEHQHALMCAIQHLCGLEIAKEDELLLRRRCLALAQLEIPRSGDRTGPPVVV